MPAISPGTAAPAPRRAASTTIPANGASTFAERPDIAVPDARILWRAAIDPGTLTLGAVSTDAGDPEALALARLAEFITIVVDPSGHEHVVVSDGWRRVRLDVISGSLAGDGFVRPWFALAGAARAQAQLLPLHGFLQLCRTGRFGASLFPPVTRSDRQLTLLRVHDALVAGASQREIAAALVGAARAGHEWRGASEALRSRVRRLVRDARIMAAGGYRWLLRRDRRETRPPIDR
ncbi:DUF2285 domain-containing protein [Sphingomonas koreensis]|nr:DUF2285 domain-containing protein [Sphingomonas koreensis]